MAPCKEGLGVSKPCEENGIAMAQKAAQSAPSTLTLPQ